YFAEKSYQSTPLNPCETISPGSEASGSSFPSTPHSTSTPDTNSSTSTFSSWRNASSTAGASPSSEPTFVIPTEEPSRAGLPQTGKPQGLSGARPDLSAPFPVAAVQQSRLL